MCILRGGCRDPDNGRDQMIGNGGIMTNVAGNPRGNVTRRGEVSLLGPKGGGTQNILPARTAPQPRLAPRVDSVLASLGTCEPRLVCSKQRQCSHDTAYLLSFGATEGGMCFCVRVGISMSTISQKKRVSAIRTCSLREKVGRCTRCKARLLPAPIRLICAPGARARRCASRRESKRSQG
eukprot:gene10779-biopygen7793